MAIFRVQQDYGEYILELQAFRVHRKSQESMLVKDMILEPWFSPLYLASPLAVAAISLSSKHCLLEHGLFTISTKHRHIVSRFSIRKLSRFYARTRIWFWYVCLLPAFHDFDKPIYFSFIKQDISQVVMHDQYSYEWRQFSFIFDDFAPTFDDFHFRIFSAFRFYRRSTFFLYLLRFRIMKPAFIDISIIRAIGLYSHFAGQLARHDISLLDDRRMFSSWFSSVHL